MSEIYAEMLKANQHVDLFGGPAKEQELTATLRDQFAMVAIQGSVGKLPYDYEKRDEYIKNLAVGAYMIADAMMEERQWLPEKKED
jgi:hypothetical protein